MGLIDADGNVLQEGAIGYAAVVFGLLAPEATLNPRVASDTIDSQNKPLQKAFAKNRHSFQKGEDLVPDAGVEPQLKKKLSENYNYDLKTFPYRRRVLSFLFFLRTF